MEGYLEIGFGIFEPGNFFPVSRVYGQEGFSSIGNVQKHQRMVFVSAQISTQAIRLMVRVRGGVSEAFLSRFSVIYPWSFPS